MSNAEKKHHHHLITTLYPYVSLMFFFLFFSFIFIALSMRKVLPRFNENIIYHTLCLFFLDWAHFSYKVRQSFSCFSCRWFIDLNGVLRWFFIYIIPTIAHLFLFFFIVNRPRKKWLTCVHSMDFITTIDIVYCKFWKKKSIIIKIKPINNDRLALYFWAEGNMHGSFVPCRLRL